MFVEVENRRGGGDVQFGHQLHIGVELGLHVSRDAAQCLEGAGLAGLFVVVQGLLRVFRRQQCGRLAGAVFTDDANHDVA